jgi:hypothetical protein
LVVPLVDQKEAPTVSRELGRIALILALGVALVAAPRTTSAQQVKVVTFDLVTTAQSSSGRNFDVLASLPLTKIKRYTVTVGPLPVVHAGVDKLTLRVGVLSTPSNNMYAATVFDRDVATIQGGSFAGPYVGTNSYITLQRGADGLGNVTLRVNVYIEIGP